MARPCHSSGLWWRVAQIDDAVEKATSEGRTGSAMALADQQWKIRTDLVARRTSKVQGAGGAPSQKAKVDGEGPGGRG
jgi:hypothetical protein